MLKLVVLVDMELEVVLGWYGGGGSSGSCNVVSGNGSGGAADCFLL